MARKESDREDFMAEATALTRRAEIQIASLETPVVFGYRDNDHFSLYLNPDLVYHFDDQMRLRRAYLAGFLYRSEGTTLARLKRVREEGKSELHRHDLFPEELARLFAGLRGQLAGLELALKNGEYQVLRQIPENLELIPILKESVERWLSVEPRLTPSLK